MITDKIFKILQDNLYIDHSYNPGYSTIENREDCAQLIVDFLIPTLNWKDNTNVSFSTGGGKMCVIRKTDDTYTTTFPVGFTGTLDECKHYCSMWVRDEYLKLCNGQS